MRRPRCPARAARRTVSVVLGVGPVFVTGVGILLLGAVLMTWYGLCRPESFRGETLRKDTPALVMED